MLKYSNYEHLTQLVEEQSLDLFLSCTQENKLTIITRYKQGWKYHLLQWLPRNPHYKDTLTAGFKMLWNRDLKCSLSREGFSKPLLLTEEAISLIYTRSWNIHEDYTPKILLIASIFKDTASERFRPKMCPSSAQKKKERGRYNAVKSRMWLCKSNLYFTCFREAPSLSPGQRREKFSCRVRWIGWAE